MQTWQFFFQHLLLMNTYWKYHGGSNNNHKNKIGSESTEKNTSSINLFARIFASNTKLIIQFESWVRFGTKSASIKCLNVLNVFIYGVCGLFIHAISCCSIYTLWACVFVCLCVYRKVKWKEKYTYINTNIDKWSKNIARMYICLCQHWIKMIWLL